MPNRAELLKQNFQNSVALPFDPVLSEVVMQKVLDEQGVRYRQTLYTPIVVVWAWIAQVLDADKRLSNAVKRVVAWLAVAEESIPSTDTGACSKARKRLPLSVYGLCYDKLQPLYRVRCDQRNSGADDG